MFFQNISKTLVILFLTLFALSGCSKENSPQTAPETVGQILGVVRDMSSNAPIGSATVATRPTTSSVLTDAAGYFALSDVSAGNYYVLASKSGYRTDSVAVSVVGGRATRADMLLSVAISPPQAPVALAADSITPTGFTAHWRASVGATEYRFDVSMDDFATMVSEYNNMRVTRLSQPVTGLSRNTLYKYRVRALNAGGSSANSNTISIKTLLLPEIAPVSNLFAYSADSISVGLAWTASTDENLSEFNHYSITVKLQNGVTLKTDSATKGSNGILVSGLQAGVTYTFEVVAMPVQGTQNYSQSPTVTIRWSPAFRLTSEGTFPIKVYETMGSANSYAALVLFHPATRGPKTVSLTNPGSDAALIDLYVRSEAGSAVSWRSAHLYNAGWRLTRFSSTTRNVNSLNDPQAAPPDTITYSLSNNSKAIDSVAVSTSRIYYFKGNNGNYGRILVKRNPGNGTLIWGTSPEQYLNIEISYQTQPYNPFSKR